MRNGDRSSVAKGRERGSGKTAELTGLVEPGEFVRDEDLLERTDGGCILHEPSIPKTKEVSLER
jgi:hypothetical protein